MTVEKPTSFTDFHHIFITLMNTSYYRTKPRDFLRKSRGFVPSSYFFYFPHFPLQILKYQLDIQNLDKREKSDVLLRDGLLDLHNHKFARLC